MSPDESVLAICVNWNGEEVLRESIRSLLDSDHPEVNVVVVDNNSDSFSEEMIPSGVEILRLSENRGYGEAINSALRRFVYTSPEARLKPEFILVLNNDLSVPIATITQLIRCSREKNAHIVGPRVVRADDPERLEAAWGRVVWSHVLVRLEGKNGSSQDPRWQKEREVDLLLGSFLLIRREVFDQVGLFDPLFFMYHEEVDFQYRARKAGFSIRYCPSTEVQHRGGYSTRRRPELKILWTRRNTVLFFRKHEASPGNWGKFWVTLTLSLLFNAFLLRTKRVRAILKGVQEGFSTRISND